VDVLSLGCRDTFGSCQYAKLGVSNSQERSHKFYIDRARFRGFPVAGWTRRGTLENNRKSGNPAHEKESSKVEIEQIRFMWKDQGSNIGDCPALYEVPGGYVVQGKALSDQTTGRLRDLGSDETAVFVPANVLDRLRVT
jgi:hypothetical protein